MTLCQRLAESAILAKAASLKSSPSQATQAALLQPAPYHADARTTANPARLGIRSNRRTTCSSASSPPGTCGTSCSEATMSAAAPSALRAHSSLVVTGATSPDASTSSADNGCLLRALGCLDACKWSHSARWAAASHATEGCKARPIVENRSWGELASIAQTWHKVHALAAALLAAAGDSCGGA